jgi:hypothetical protein
MHTEDEAKKLWCPMVRHEGNGATFNRGWAEHNPLNQVSTTGPGDGPAAFICNCIGTRCAAWRWSDPAPAVVVDCRDARATREPLRPDGLPPGWLFVPSLCGATKACWVPPRDEGRRLGYCGLFGQPMIR